MGTGRPLLSAAIISKNEERFIGACLESITGFVDEIVVVDTGSTDATVEIARAGGALVHSYPWNGNFSNARNRSLELATGEWILYIDCDEQLVASKSDVVAARRLLATSTQTVAFRVLFSTIVGNTPYREYRMWRHRPDIRFHGVIHETIVSDLRRINRVEGLAIDPIDVMLQHYGYEGDQRRKHERNLPLLHAQLLNDPRRVYLWWHLGVVQAALGMNDEALASWRHGVEIVREDGWKSQTDLLAVSELAFRLAVTGLPVADLVELGLAYDPECHTLTVVDLIVAVREKRADDVECLAERLLAAGRVGVQSNTLSYPQRFFDTIPWKALAESRWERGDIVGAAAAYRELVFLEPGDLEYRTKAAAAGAAGAARTTVSG